MIAGELANMAAGRPKENAPDLGNLLSTEPAQAAAVSVQKAADMLNVGRGTVEAARKVIRKGVPELAAAVKAGDIAVSTAAELVRQPEEVQREVVAAASRRAGREAPRRAVRGTADETWRPL